MAGSVRSASCRPWLTKIVRCFDVVRPYIFFSFLQQKKRRCIRSRPFTLRQHMQSLKRVQTNRRKRRFRQCTLHFLCVSARRTKKPLRPDGNTLEGKQIRTICYFRNRKREIAVIWREFNSWRLVIEMPISSASLNKKSVLAIPQCCGCQTHFPTPAVKLSHDVMLERIQNMSSIRYLFFCDFKQSSRYLQTDLKVTTPIISLLVRNHMLLCCCRQSCENCKSLSIRISLVSLLYELLPAHEISFTHKECFV